MKKFFKRFKFTVEPIYTECFGLAVGYESTLFQFELRLLVLVFGFVFTYRKGEENA